MTRLLLVMPLLVMLAPWSAAADDDVLLDSLQTWVDRAASDLALEDGAAPQRAVMATLDHYHHRAVAEFGSLLTTAGRRSRPARLEVVVGNDQLNSSRFKTRDRLDKVVRSANLVVEDVSAAIDRDLWLVSDKAYKAAVKQLMVKGAALAALGGEPPPPDWSPAEAVVSILGGGPQPVDGGPLEEIAVQASARLRDLGLDQGQVSARAVDAQFYLVTSEGTSLVQPEGYAVVFAEASLRRADGVEVRDHRQWVARTVADLPPLQELADEVERMGRGVVARAAAEPMEYYEGPVVFEGRAAVDLLRYLATEQLCGTPPPPDAKQTYDTLTRSGPRLGRRLLPAGWSVVDDPSRSVPGLPGSYEYDREGVRAQAVTLVDDGYVRDLAMSRVPRRELPDSNGHARGLVQSDWSARLSVWHVTPDRNLSARAFDKQLVRVRKATGADTVLVVRGLAPGKHGALPRPTDAVWVAADGSEQPALSLSFAETSRRTLRDIAAAGGGEQTVAYLDPRELDEKPQQTSGLPTVLTAPQVLLVEDLEVVFPGPDGRPHAYGPPPME
jgi:hypothetical protein